MVNQDVLDRLQKAREKKAPKEAKPIKRTEPLKKGYSVKAGQRSEKMKGVIAALKPLYDKFLANRPYCEIRSEVCTGTSECIHHVQGRGIKIILDDSKWRASCSACNSHVESKDEEAKARGHKVSRHSKNQ